MELGICPASWCPAAAIVAKRDLKEKEFVRPDVLSKCRSRKRLRPTAVIEDAVGTVVLSRNQGGRCQSGSVEQAGYRFVAFIGRPEFRWFRAGLLRLREQGGKSFERSGDA